jgi:hypothetical protein
MATFSTNHSVGPMVLSLKLPLGRISFSLAVPIDHLTVSQPLINL